VSAAPHDWRRVRIGAGWRQSGHAVKQPWRKLTTGCSKAREEEGVADGAGQACRKRSAASGGACGASS